MYLDVNLIVENAIQSKTGSAKHADASVKKQNNKTLYKSEYYWNSSICACERDKDCDFYEYLKLALR